MTVKKFFKKAFAVVIVMVISLFSFSAYASSESEYFCVVGSDVVEFEDSVININTKNKKAAYGFHSNNNASNIKISKSDINMNFENCQNACGTEMYQTDISGSDVDITVKNPHSLQQNCRREYFFACKSDNI